MKSKIFTLILITMVSLSPRLLAQPTQWTTSEDASNDLEFYQESTVVNEGTYSARAHLIAGVPYIYSAEFDVTAGSSYTFSIDLLDNTPGAYFKVYCEFLDASDGDIYGESPVTTSDDANWQTITWSSTVPTDAVKGYVWVKIYEDAGFTQPDTVYLDNASFIMDGGSNLVPNGGFEEWVTAPKFTSFTFEDLDPTVIGDIDVNNFTVDLLVPYVTDVSTLVPTFEVEAGSTVEVESSGTYSEVTSGTTVVDFTNARTFRITKDANEQEWTVTVTKEDPSTGTDIKTFRFEDFDPIVTGIVSPADHTVDLEVPFGTDVTALVPTITISENATITPESGVAQDFSSAVTYTVTAQDESTQDWTVTVTEASEGQTTLFFEDFEDLNVLPSDWVIINADNHTQASGEERWQDSAWVVTTSGRDELVGTKVAMASSYVEMADDESVYDWMILPSITLGGNSILSWQAMSTTSSGNYPDDYFVAVAPAVDGVTPSVSYFESEGVIVFEIAPESWSAGVSRPGEGLASHSVNLADTGYVDTDVWIAFVLNTDLYTNPETGEPNAAAGGSNLAVDNIKVVNETTSTGINIVDKNDFDVTVFPNPTSGSFKLNLESDVHSVANIEIIDMTGRTVYSKHHEINVGKNYIDVHANELNNGIYLIRTTYNNKGNVSKLMIR